MVKKHKQAPKREQKGIAPAPIPPHSSASRQPTEPSRSVFQLINNINVQRSFQLVVLAALYSPLSQLNLSPVYGSIPSAIYHRYGLIVCILIAFGVRGRLPTWLSRSIPAFCWWLPTLQFLLFQLSSYLGPTYGPLVTETLTYYPLLVLSMYVATELLEDVLGRHSGNSIADATPSMGLFLLYTFIQRSAKSWLHTYIGRHLFLSRVGAQVTLATLYFLILPNSAYYPAIPGIALTFFTNQHFPSIRTTELVNNTLALSNFTLLDRTESISGYISVLQSLQNPPLRVLRCDHSLLGGNWILPPRASNQPTRLIPEPIYAVFTMLEAIRLVSPPPVLTDSPGQHKALVIGLGIGTAPSALIKHNISTTILELDPAIHAYAVQYFELPENHNFYIGDAVEAVTTSANNLSHHRTYNYIVHDVFTGGAEPIPLFTRDFLSSLSTLLTDDGVIAINYAGDLSLPSTNMIYRTITSVFGTCRAFREEPPLTPESDTHSAKAGVDFTNLVFFCRNRPSSSSSAGTSHSVEFRRPTEADFLGSSARKEHLMPKHEVFPRDFESEGDILTKENAKVLGKQQVESAVGHWRIMRNVLPDAVWEGW